MRTAAASRPCDVALVTLIVAHRDALKRIVITSSIKAILGLEHGKTYTEEDWAEHAVNAVEEKGSEANITEVYTTSKVLAEQGVSCVHAMHCAAPNNGWHPGLAAAWSLREENKERISWDVSVICPGWAFGVSFFFLRGLYVVCPSR